ncbi:polysaccharide pyruvyl transferase family protein [Paenibacillus camelliae]|uniref:polysaccharide pyruvyl transferase family protein n=1 Tax=Paenibacillus camelliae TaxID=512410 RepID=UPI00204249D0|nr:polysaccharide pyruvyl transferase family protein [Paenibacillus camelliae]MCM3635945.1 polysaccharide pyruvyl transferase family protein [Paenibacillus camelliae]
MKIYHLASFSGNIGDVANHEAFYVQIQNKLQKKILVTEDEMRDYYKNVQIKKFDKEFVEKVNNHDLLVIGGGNFFELCWDYSDNGTTFNITNQLLKQIKTPILVNGIGIDDNKGISSDNIEKFRKFLHTLFTYNTVFFTVRNDGSYDIFQKYFPEYVDYVYEIPDFGFFVSEVQELKEYCYNGQTKSIGFNIALDMPHIRYSHLDYKKYLSAIAKEIDRLLAETTYHIYLIAHIQSDYRAILELLDIVTSKQARTRISISPLVQGKELESFKYYKECDMVFAMRFHANVCSISLGVPTFGMISYPKHGIMYDKIGIPYRKCNLEESDFINRLEHEVQRVIESPDYLIELKKDYDKARSRVNAIKDSVLDRLIDWMEEKGLN